jgi:hypothetical protein
LAVRKVTENRGKRTRGVDRELCHAPAIGCFCTRSVTGGYTPWVWR